MVPIRENLVPKDKYAIKCPYTRTPTRVVIHNTANDAPAANEISYMRYNDLEISFHYAVDDVNIVQGIPESRNAWASGDGHGKGNMEGIHIEICYSKSGGKKFDKAEQNAAEFTASLLKKYGWGIDKVTKHRDYDGKYCPHRTLDRGWQRFLSMVKRYMEPAKTPVASKFTPYLIRKNCRDALNIRKGPSTNYGILGQIKDTLRYTIVEERSGPGSHKGWGRLKAGGWIALDWVKKA
ncbi:N-acetylmuramoyl-L-alanine amidase [Hominenteromicrobium sp.]|uniref:N-acetylmuramoyl-L-alanine amidase n=1 Tax=Hominenteromicrobium sp. TaxID=3073581 RepID=UPI003A92988B